ncbi:MAG: hypothetical protein WC792_03535 [Candidatus Micrarchaeia archaeon]|jgi:hypothetical protein
MSSEEHHGHAPQHHAAHNPPHGGGRNLLLYALAILTFGALAYNQLAIFNAQNALERLSVAAFANASLATASGDAPATGTALAGAKDISKADLSKLKSTQQSVAALFPVEGITTQQDAIDVMIPTGTPGYGEAMGVSFDDPVNSLNLLARSYDALKEQVKAEHPETWNRFMALASRPVGISCEYCCGIGPIGIDANGNSACGCQHNPAVLTVTLWLMDNTQYSDAEVLREALKWKTIFFPKNMVELAMKASGTSGSAEGELPGMVGGC